MEIDGIIYEKSKFNAEELRQLNREENERLAGFKPESYVKNLICDIDKAIAWEKEHSPTSQKAVISRRWSKKTYSGELTEKVRQIVTKIYENSGFGVEFCTKTENYLRIVIFWNEPVKVEVED